MNEENIIQRCKQHDVGAYKMIYERYGQPLLHTATRMLGRQQDAEDAVQMTFLNLYRGIHNYRAGSHFSTYLFRILLNVCYDDLRKRSRMKTQALEGESVSRNPDLEEKWHLEKAIAALPERMRACFILFVVEEFKQAEIAAIMNMTLGGVKATIFQAKARLRAFLSESQREEKP